MITIMKKDFNEFLVIVISVLILFSSCTKTQDEKLSESTVAVVKNTMSETAARELKSSVKEIVSYTSKDAVVAAVEEKYADYLVFDEYSLECYAKNGKKFKKIKELQYKAEYYIYFCKNSVLKDEFNKVILDLIQSGEIEKIKQKHIYSTDYEIPLTDLGENAKTLVMTTDVLGKPYSDLSDDGVVTGIDIDIAMLIANKLGCNLEILVTDFDKMFTLLNDSTADFAVSGLLYSEERAENFDCSISYLSEKYYLAK